MATPTDRLGLARPDDGSEDWGQGYRDAMTTLDSHPGVRVVEAVADVATPWVGQQVYETGLGRTCMWTGSVWEPVRTGTDPTPPAQAYTHSQAIPSNHWVIDHPLTFQPNITVLDSTGREVDGEVLFSPGRVEVFFNATFAGSALLS
jgi:hypothetical protein